MEYLLPLFLIILAFFTGTAIERKHYSAIHAGEQEFLNLPAITSEDLVKDYNFQEVQMVHGSVVISLDYFKRFLAGLRFFFGGRVKTYETLLDRGRREAILRMKKQAKDTGCTLIVNMRFETASIGQVSSRASLGCFEVLAYGTGIKLA